MNDRPMKILGGSPRSAQVAALIASVLANQPPGGFLSHLYARRTEPERKLTVVDEQRLLNAQLKRDRKAAKRLGVVAAVESVSPYQAVVDDWEANHTRADCSACSGTGSGADAWDCLVCEGDGWVWLPKQGAAA